jgi:CheY-like chemotaxis protein
MTTDPTQHHSLVRAVHAARDVLERQRVHYFGAVISHDLNNALFALVGRLQIVRRKITDPLLAQTLDQVLETARHIEAQISTIHAACPRDPSAESTSVARKSIAAAIHAAAATLPMTLANVETAINEIPADAMFSIDERAVTSAIAQLLSMHRERNAKMVAVACACVGTIDAPRIELSFTDHAGAWTHDLRAPSLLDGSFDLATLSLGTAHRAVRDDGGIVELTRTDDGVRSGVSFAIRRGIVLPQEGDRERSACGHAEGDAGGDAESDRFLPRRVLIADDDVAVRAVLVAALEAVGDDVDTTDDPSSIARRTDLQTFDAIVLDAGGGGIEALLEIRARGSVVPVLIASGDIIEGNFGEPTRVLMKPFHLHELDRQLATLAALGRRAGPSTD